MCATYAMNDSKESDNMGGRGAYSPSFGRSGGIPLENRGYTCIGKLSGIKILRCDIASNNPSPTFSNTANTTYFSFSEKNNCIERILFYRNHRLIKSIDLKTGCTPHTHFWNQSGGAVGRKRHDRRNTFELAGRDWRLTNLAIIYNANKNNN